MSTKAERCFKLDCRSTIQTWEQDIGPGAEPFPAGLCLQHAQRPDRVGTIAKPTPVPGPRNRVRP